MSLLFGIAISLVFGLPLVLIGFHNLGRAVESFAGLVGIVPGFFFATRMTLRKPYRGFRIVLQATEPTNPAFVKIALAMALVVAVLAILGGAYLFWRAIPKPANEYYGLVLNADTKRDVHYKLGTPTVVYSEKPEASGLFKGFRMALTVDKLDGFDQIPSGREFTSYSQWGYAAGSDNGFPVQVSFGRAGKVIDVNCAGKKPGDCPSLLGIDIGDSETRLKSLLGTPTSESIDELGWKMMIYRSLNANFKLERQRVISIGMSLH